MPPIKLMMPFAVLRWCAGNRSPSKAIVGARKSAMLRLVSRIANMMPTTVPMAGTRMKNSAASGAPTSIHGLRRPRRVRVRSERSPTTGWTNIFR